MFHIADYSSSDEDSNDAEKTNAPLPSSLISSLPKPVAISRKLNEEGELEDIVTKKHKWETGAIVCPPKKSKGPVKISIPTVPLACESDDDDDETVLRKVRGPSGPSSLLSMLPDPKMKGSSAVPKPFKTSVSSVQSQSTTNSNVVASAVRVKLTTLVPSTVLAARKKPQQSIISSDYVSEDSDEESAGDFFRLESNVSKTTDNATDVEDYNELDRFSTKNARSVNVIVSSTTTSSIHPSQMYNYANVSSEDLTPGPSDRNDGMDEARRIIYKNEISSFGDDYVLPDDLPIIDVSVDSQLGNVQETLIKNITDATTRPADPALEAARLALAEGGKKKKKDKPAQQAKRKHQITYLAHLAKEREETLKNQWAQNKHSRKETQMKYGF